MKKHKLQLLLFLTIYLGSIVKAQINTNISSLQAKIPVWLSENNVPACGIGIIEDSKIKYVKVFGELKKGVPAPDNAIFSVASITKPVVTMLTLKLVESGQWNLEEPLYNYWVDPDVASDPFHKKLTTRHVLNHQTGFPNWRKGKLAFEFEPGTNFQYSGEGFEYLRRAIEKKFNKSLAELADSILFKPIGMIDSRLCWDKNIDESRFACLHDSKGNIYRPSMPKGGKVNAAASLLTTVEDLCKFSIYVMNGFGLSSDIYNDMIKPHVKLKEHYARGLGWEIISDLPGGEFALKHSGSQGGVKAIFVLLPKSKQGMVILTNGDKGIFVYNNVIREFVESGQTLLNYLMGSDTHKVVTLTKEILDRYVGDYLDSYGRNLSIAREDSILKFTGNSLPTVKLYPESEKKFFVKDFDVQFEFVNDDSLVLIANGKIDWTAKKIKQQPIINLPDEVLERYVGTYVRLDNYSDIHVIKGEGSRLKISGETVPPMELLPTGEYIFFAKGLPFQFEFLKGKSGDIIKMNVIGNGKVVCETKRKDYSSQGKTIAQEVDSISIKYLHQYMDSIATDITEGRFTGSPGYKKAAQYAADVFRKAGLNPGYTNEKGEKSYFQPVPFIRNNYESSSITIWKNGIDKIYMHSADNFVFLNTGVPDKNIQTISPAFVGYGIHEPEKGWDDYAGIDVKGKWVIVLNGMPPANANPAFPEYLRTQYGNWKVHDSLKLNALMKHNVAGLIVLPDKYATDNWESSVLHNYRYNYIHYADSDVKKQAVSGPVLPVILIHPELAQVLFADQNFDPITNKGNYHSYILDNTEISVKINCKKESINCSNVIAVVPGNDSVLKKEYITVGAHLDHLGKIGDHVYNGANDDASGCVIILEAAKKIALNPPKKSVLFILYTSEEQHLIGSRHFLENPPISIEQISLNINLEQIGSKNRDFPGIWAIGSPKFKESFNKIGNSFKETDLKFDPVENLRDALKDQVDLRSYYEKGIPVIMLSSGGFPEHHTIRDKIDLIDFEHLSIAAKFLHSFIVKLGNE